MYELSKHDQTAATPTSTALRLGAAAIILVVSAAASSFPSLARHAPRIQPPEVVFFIGKHFGTGVILSTAFVHLLQEAFESLSNPCLGGKWKDLTGFLVLISFLGIFLVEYISTAYVERISNKSVHHHHHHHSHSKNSSNDGQGREHDRTHIHEPLIPYHDDPNDGLELEIDVEQGRGLIPDHNDETQLNDLERLAQHSAFEEHIPSAPNEVDSEHSDYPCSSPFDRPHKKVIPIGHHRHESPSSHQHKSGPRLEQRQHIPPMYIPEQEAGTVVHAVRLSSSGPEEGCHGGLEVEQESGVGQHDSVSRSSRIVAILVLQLGIMLHSVVIGLTLSITDGANFTTLLAAVIFHQLFEGLSLGIRISSLPASHSPSRIFRLLPLILCFLFAVTAPLGLVLGIGALPSSSKPTQLQLNLAPPACFSTALNSSSTLSSFLSVTPDNLPSQEEYRTALLTQGLLCALSAGMLIYASAVEMLAGDFVLNAEMRKLSVRRQTLGVVSLVMGVVGMGIIGIWT